MPGSKDYNDALARLGDVQAIAEQSARLRKAEMRKAIKRQIGKKAKELVNEYTQKLAESLPEIAPVLTKLAVRGNIQAIKEVHDVVGAKKNDGNVTAIQVNISEDRNKYE